MKSAYAFLDNSKGDMVHPWVRGFRPVTAVCPVCKTPQPVYTGEYTEETAFHIYQCLREGCEALFAAPTFYAWCNFDGTVLEKDHFYTPCIHGACPHYLPRGDRGTQCIHYEPADQGDLEARQVKKIEQHMVNTSVRPNQPPPDPGSAGISSYKSMRAARLKMLEEGLLKED